MLLQMTTSSYTPKHTIWWSSMFSTNMVSHLISSWLNTHGMVQVKEQWMLLSVIVLSNILINAYHTKFQPWIMHDLILTPMIVKVLKLSLMMWQCFLVQTWIYVLHWYNKHSNSSNGGINSYVFWRHYRSQKCCCAIYIWHPDKYEILCPSAPVLTDTMIMLHSQQSQHQIPVLALTKGTWYLGIYVT